MRISICVPTYKRPDFLTMCLASLLGALPDHRVAEVLVAVTGKAEDSLDYRSRSMLEALWMQGIEVTVQDGFKGLLTAKQWFAKNAKGEVLLLLDDDAAINRNYFDLVSHFEGIRGKNVAAVSGSLQTPLDVGHYIDWSGEPIPAPKKGTLCNRLTMADDLVIIKDKYQVYMLDEPRVYDCEVLVGTALMIRKDLLEIDPKFADGKFYYEEYDFTYGLYREGYRLLYDSGRVAWHVRADEGGMRALENRDKSVNGSYFKEKYGL